jgi:hypothetical protein
MLDAFKRWMGRDERPAAVDWSDTIDWAASRGLAFRRERDDRGFVVEGRAGAYRWRLEWGPPQRSYLEGRELRLRCELGLPRDLQMLLVSRELAETLEREVFNRFTEQAQTEVDLDLPEEMRWLALYRRASLSAWKGLRPSLEAVSAVPGTVEAWLDDAAFVEALEKALEPQPAEGPRADARARPLRPLVLMTLRGRLYLRTELAEPHRPTLDAVRALFETAIGRLDAARAALGQRPSGRGAAPPASESESDTGAVTAWQDRDIGSPDDDLDSLLDELEGRGRKPG